MPKIVDHEERRSEVLEATWRVISNEGLESATVRRIAKEVGLSKGALAHYFTSKDDILIQAHKLAYDRVFARVGENIDSFDGFEKLRYMLHEALPLDQERWVEAVIDISYIGRAMNSKELKEVRRESAANARIWWLDALHEAQRGGHISADLDLETTFEQISVMIDGISMQAVIYPEVMTSEKQHKIADVFLEWLRAKK